MLSVDSIASWDQSVIENNLRDNGKSVSLDLDANRITLIRSYMIYLPHTEQVYVYAPEFEDAFVRAKGSMDAIKKLIEPSEYECGYVVRTMSFLYTYEREQLRVLPSSIPVLYQIAQVLDIDVTITPDRICEQIKSKAPSVEWQIQNGLDASKFEEDTKKFISQYTDYAFERINSGLRYGAKETHLNKFIETLQPLERDIYVLRYVHNKKFPETGIFRSLGYLSTSIAYEKYLMTPKERNVSVMRILVPKGKKAIFVQGHESELIFPHDIELEILKHYNKDVFNEGTHYKVDWYDMKML
jgi:hypothetical protein